MISTISLCDDVGQGNNACLINIKISTAKSFANSGLALLTTGNCAEVDEQSGMLKGKQAGRYVKGRVKNKASGF